jgi:hypothetical protein
MGFTEERFANQPNLDAGDRSFNGGAQPCPSRPNDEYVVFESFVIAHVISKR